MEREKEEGEVILRAPFFLSLSPPKRKMSANCDEIEIGRRKTKSRKGQARQGKAGQGSQRRPEEDEVFLQARLFVSPAGSQRKMSVD